VSALTTYPSGKKQTAQHKLTT